MAKNKGIFPLRIGWSKRRSRITAMLVLLLLLSSAIAAYYLQTRKNKIAGAVLEALNEKYRGEFGYGRMTLDYWVDFSNPSIYFEDLVVTDTVTENHLRLHAEELSIELSIEDLLKGLIQIRSAKLNGGELLLDNYSPLTSQEQMGLPPLRDSLEVYTPITNTLLQKNTQLDITDLHVRIRHHVKNKRFEFQVNEITSDIEFTNETIRSRTSMDVNIGALGFNLKSGSFASGAEARGTFESVFDLPREELQIDTFPLELGDQVFDTSAKLNFMGSGSFDIALENPKTNFASTLDLLTEGIREKFDPIAIEGPLHTRARLEGGFFYRNNPRILVHFQTEDNTAVLGGDKRLTDLNFSGEFENRVYADERADMEDPKNFRIHLPELRGRLKDINFRIEDMDLASSPDAENAFAAGIRASGSPESLNEFVDGQHWSFRGGEFQLTSDIKGEGLDLASLLSASSSRFSLANTELINNENKVGLPVSAVSLSIRNNRATLEELKIQVTPRDDLVIRAGFDNFSGLFTDNPKSTVRSQFSIESENLKWEDFIRLFEIASPGRQATKPEIVLQDLLKDIQRKYDPEIDIALRKFRKGPYLLTDVNSRVHFENANLMRLDTSSFGIQGGRMQMEGQLDLSHADRIPLEASLEGRAGVAVLNHLLDKDQLNLQGGDFQFSANLSGDLLHPEEILRNSGSLVLMNDVRATYVPAKVTFPIKSLELQLRKDRAELKALTLHLGEQDEVTFSGEVQNLSSLLFGGTRQPVTSELHIQSEKLIWEDCLQIFEAMGREKTEVTRGEPEGLIEAERKFKASLRDVHTALSPRITVDIKEFRYKDMEGFHELQTGISFKDGQTLQLEETRFLYNRETAVRMHAEIDITDTLKTHVAMQLEASGDPQELNEVLNNDTFLFRGGTFKVSARIRGDIEALDSLIAHSDSDLKIRDTFIMHKPSQVHMPITLLDVGLHNNTATLKSFEVELESGDHIILKGEVGYVSDLIFDLPPEVARTYSSIDLHADKLNFEEFKSLFAIRKEGTPAKEHEIAIRPAIRDVYNKYRPSLTVSIDEFELERIGVRNLRSGFHFEDQDRIYLEESVFDFHEGSVRLDAHLDISEPDKTFFAFGFVTDRIDLDRLLKAFDYFEMPSLKASTRIGGLVSLDTEIEGEVDSDGLIVPESLRGTISFDLEEAQVAGFDPLIQSGGKIFRKERLEDIRFMPLENTMILSDKTLKIPLMEIQSSAFELFVAGDLGFGEVPTNLWIGFPLNNLKTRDVRNVPDKKGYIASGKKVYVEAKSHEKKGMKYVLHLTPKKFYQEREMLETYRGEIGDEGLQIRQYKRKGAPQSNE